MFRNFFFLIFNIRFTASVTNTFLAILHLCDILKFLKLFFVSPVVFFYSRDCILQLFCNSHVLFPYVLQKVIE